MPKRYQVDAEQMALIIEYFEHSADLLENLERLFSALAAGTSFAPAEFVQWRTRTIELRAASAKMAEAFADQV